MCAYNGFDFDFKLILPYLKKTTKVHVEKLGIHEPLVWHGQTSEDESKTRQGVQANLEKYPNFL